MLPISYWVSFLFFLFSLRNVAFAAEKGVAKRNGPAAQFPVLPGPVIETPKKDNSHHFSLRHIFHHGTYSQPNLYKRIDVHPKARLMLRFDDGHVERASPLVAQSRKIGIQRLKDRRPGTISQMMRASRVQGGNLDVVPSAWTVDEVPGPNISNKDTILSMAYMAVNAYVLSDNSTEWEDIGSGFNRTKDIGWEGDSLRGHVYADETNSTIVIGIKGTSAALWDGEETTTNDKINDNLFGSCCCGQQGVWTWRQVCDCATSTYTCNSTCLVSALMEESRYYTAAKYLYSNVTAIYPDSNIWLVGHSLGGAVTGLLGLTYGLPAVTFQAVPHALAASRLGLPSPPNGNRSLTGIYHFGHTADPVYMGSCNGATSTCSWAGYAFEATCHTAQSCIYDVVSDKGWRVSIRTHPLRAVIKDVIIPYDETPNCESTPECVDCFNWKFYESHNGSTTTTSTITTTSSSSRSSRTRTLTCKTPGWWGCLDETTTTTPSNATAPITSTTTTATSTCKTKGWFGCLDEPATTTTATTSSSKKTTTTTTCKTPGWWGCNDKPDSTTTSTTETNAEFAAHTPRITKPPDFELI